MKPTLLLLPGTLCDGRIFNALKWRLKKVVNVQVADLQNYSDTDALCNKLLGQLPEHFSMAGFSLGGLLALELLRRAPVRVERIALIASNARAGSKVGHRKSKTLKNLWFSAGPVKVSSLVLPNYFHHEISRQRHANLVQDMALRTPRSAAFAQFDWAAHRPDGHAVLAAFAGPVLVVSGAKDRLCPPPWQRDLVEAQPRAHWIELPRVGHFVPLEAPTSLGKALQGWLHTQGAAN
jgi:pimeloyl-ACP methyl ester carboxylesterase